MADFEKLAHSLDAYLRLILLELIKSFAYNFDCILFKEMWKVLNNNENWKPLSFVTVCLWYIFLLSSILHDVCTKLQTLQPNLVLCFL